MRAFLLSFLFLSKKAIRLSVIGLVVSKITFEQYWYVLLYLLSLGAPNDLHFE